MLTYCCVDISHHHKVMSNFNFSVFVEMIVELPVNARDKKEIGM